MSWKASGEQVKTDRCWFCLLPLVVQEMVEPRWKRCGRVARRGCGILERMGRRKQSYPIARLGPYELRGLNGASLPFSPSPTKLLDAEQDEKIEVISSRKRRRLSEARKDSENVELLELEVALKEPAGRGDTPLQRFTIAYVELDTLLGGVHVLEGTPPRRTEDGSTAIKLAVRLFDEEGSSGGGVGTCLLEDGEGACIIAVRHATCSHAPYCFCAPSSLETKMPLACVSGRLRNSHRSGGPCACEPGTIWQGRRGAQE
jgi:hypothetical protein